MILRLAARNLLRHRLRTLTALSATAFGAGVIVFVGGYFADTFFKMRESYIKAHTGHLQISAAGFAADRRSDPFAHLLRAPERLVDRIRRTCPGSRIAPRLATSAILTDGAATVLCRIEGVGTDGVDVASLGQKASDARAVPGLLMESGSFLDASDPTGIILGAGLARRLHARVGETLTALSSTVDGATNAVDFTVRGIFVTAAEAFDDRTARAPVSAVQSLLRTEGLQTLVVYLPDTRDTGRAARALQGTLGSDVEIRRWEELNDFYAKTHVLFMRIFAVVALVIAAIVVMSLHTTIALSVSERRTEIGTLRAIGQRRGSILRLFLMEGCLLGTAGAVAGALMGFGVVFIAGTIGIPMPPPPGASLAWISRPLAVPSVGVAAIALLGAAGLLAAVLPALRASRLDPAVALRGDVV